MLRIGLTGGIGSGKSAAADCFGRLGVPIVDADRIARELVLPGSPALNAIIKAFGSTILDDDGNLDRVALRQIVFKQDEKRRQLEGILHPLIRQAMLAQAEQAEAPYVILVIPLLFETGMGGLVHRTLVVDVTEAQQRQRAAQRDGTSAEDIQRIMAHQCGRDQRIRQADDIIDNSQDLHHLQRQVDALHRKYLDLATQ